MNTNENERTRYSRFFDTFVYGFMCHDIEEAIKAKTNFLVALGLSVYTEAMGGLVTGRFKDSRCSGRNFRAFLPYLGQSYVSLDTQIDLYRKVRCGLAHEYFVKGQSTICVRFDPPIAPGIVYQNGAILFAVENYYRDFRNAINKYLDELLKGSRPDMVRNFFGALR